MPAQRSIAGRRRTSRTTLAQLLHPRQGSADLRVSLRTQRPSDVPFAEGVCEVQGITRDELDENRLKRQNKAKVFQRQMMYSLYDLVVLSERLQHQITTLKNAPLRCRRQMIVIRVVPPLFKTGCKRSVFFSDFVKATKQQQEERRYRQIISDLPVRFEGSLAELFEQRHQFQCGFASPYFGDYSP